jgi:CRP-like cAMP-binding protein
MEELLQYLCSVHLLSEETLALLGKIVEPLNIRKGHILLKIGDVNDRLYFIKKGVLHCHYFVDGRPVSAGFFWETDTVVSIGSFYTQRPSEDCLEALTDCELFYITRSHFDHLCRNFPDFSYLANLRFMHYLEMFHDHARLIRKHKAEERYRLALEKFPELAQRIPGKLIASWLSMEEATLSRGRNRRRGRKK